MHLLLFRCCLILIVLNNDLMIFNLPPSRLLRRASSSSSSAFAVVTAGYNQQHAQTSGPHVCCTSTRKMTQRYMKIDTTNNTGKKYEWKV